MRLRPQVGSSSTLIGVVVLATVAAAVTILLHSAPRSAPARSDDPPSVDVDLSPNPDAGEPRHPVTVRAPAGPPRVLLARADAQRDAVTASCSTCHSTRLGELPARSADDLVTIHRGLVFEHGSTTCASCHDTSDLDRLRLADQRSIDYADVQTLCAQCHARQADDYAHGAHGGMAGFWDLRRGPRTRLGCLDCHDPHAPAFPRMRPTFRPRDRFLTPRHEEHASHD